jgi:methionyl-tRNA synthetase
MSKSRGNIVRAEPIHKVMGTDALRYFLLREVTFGQDGSYSAEAIVNRANAELANSFGNLAQRVLTQIVRNCGGGPPEIHGHNDADNALFGIVCKAVGETMPAAYEDFAFSRSTESWIQAVFACNAYIDEQAPWALKKTDPQRMETVLATLYICIAVLAVGIRPIIAASADKLLDGMGVAIELRTFDGILSHWYSPLAESDFRLAPPTPLFPRLELPEAEEAAA